MSPEERAARVAPLVVEQVRRVGGGDMSGIGLSRDPLGAIDVFVDRSLTIQPYDRREGTVFARLVGSFDDFIGSEIAFYGFGYPTRDTDVQEVRRASAPELLARETYGFANNDYASLFRTFRKDGKTRVVITDGVQSDPENGARLAAVADELNRWVSGGGAFGALLYRNPYHGQYYSDLQPGVQPRYQCENRPLVMFVLAPSSRAVGDLLARLDSIPPEYVVRIGGNDVTIRPISETVPAAGARRGIRVSRDIDSTLVRGYLPIASEVVIGRAGDAFHGYVPLQFDVVATLDHQPWKGLGLDATVAFIKGLRPEMQGWAIDDRALADTSGAARGRIGKRVLDIDVGALSPPTVRQVGQRLVARFTVPVRRPATREHDFALLLTLRPSEAGALSLIPSSVSTDDDRLPQSCDRALKLRRLLGSILLRNYIPGRALVLADWR